MKKASAVLMPAFVLASTLNLYPQTSSPTATSLTAVERQANSTVWQKTNYLTTASGQTIPRVSRLVQLASGLNYQDPATGQWTPSKEEIDGYTGGAIAQYGQHKVIFANNLNTAGAIDLQMSDGRELKSDVLGLSYYDTAGGKSVLIAQIKDCQGQIVHSNQVVYADL